MRIVFGILLNCWLKDKLGLNIKCQKWFIDYNSRRPFQDVQRLVQNNLLVIECDMLLENTDDCNLKFQKKMLHVYVCLGANSSHIEGTSWRVNMRSGIHPYGMGHMIVYPTPSYMLVCIRCMHMSIKLPPPVYNQEKVE